MTNPVTQDRLVGVSVIIPTRNRLDFLKEAVASVSSQDCPARETIVIDDASQDGTWQWLSSLLDPQIRVFRLPQHRERSAARNVGLKNALGEFVIFLDDDDLLEPGALTYLYAAAQRHPEALAVVGARISFDDRGYWYRPPHPFWTVKRKAWPDVLFGCIPSQGQTIVRREALLAAGGWNEGWNVAEDHELWLRTVSVTSVILFCPKVVLRLRVHSGQTPLIFRYRRYVNLRRDFVRRLPLSRQSLGLKIFLAQRLNLIAARWLRRGKSGRAAYYYASALAKAPGLLCSPLPAIMLLGGWCRAVIGFTFGKNLLIQARNMKASLRALQRPRIGLRTDTSGHNTMT